ncbi:Os01g0740000 [Oryza sativa Japonica Group]|uniref:Os01g0740000 protein n=1 Tax=Oryza sativa subsp. japonica TaxID=39947 RepID=A0A0P0V803_ORYSJ|nr:hypothetical protein EE612_005618 [Oryza sativa]KAF2952207.1 hypothetical protein DAI22_01g318800 [Oryza sativa Japonica Group]BAS74264.1 Os01g0740000 [Oryza sativa Japonica Group]
MRRAMHAWVVVVRDRAPDVRSICVIRNVLGRSDRDARWTAAFPNKCFARSMVEGCVRLERACVRATLQPDPAIVVADRSQIGCGCGCRFVVLEPI